MEISGPERHEVIGNLLVLEKYRFLSQVANGLIGEIVNDAFDKLEELHNGN